MKRFAIPLSPLDLLAVLGLLTLAIGCGLIYLPAAFVVVGALLLLYAYLATRPPGGATP